MMLEETTTTTVPETSESKDTELLEEILLELQKMNEEEVVEEPVEEVEEVYTEFQQAVIENQQVDNSISIGLLGMLLFLVGVILAKITFRKM